MEEKGFERGGDRLRVAAYCRVSTDKEDQRSSLAAQQAFFQSYIQTRSGWVLVEVFADEGLSGTSARRRPQFTEMVRRALEGEVDLILTKEVSRFARNTVDTLQITRQLKARGVGVVFLVRGDAAVGGHPQGAVSRAGHCEVSGSYERLLRMVVCEPAEL